MSRENMMNDRKLHLIDMLNYMTAEKSKDTKAKEAAEIGNRKPYGGAAKIKLIK